MNRRDYFLACLNVLLTSPRELGPGWMFFGKGTPRLSLREISEVQSEAWRIPEEAIPSLDPARAALDFYFCHFGSDVAKPPWLHAWEESLGSK